MPPLTRRYLLSLGAGLPLWLAGCDGGVDPVSRRGDALAGFLTGSSWLVAQQGEDGSVRAESDGYATGQFLTPTCAVALTEMMGVRGVAYQGRAVGRMIDFLLARRSRNGAIGFAESTPVHPVIGTSLTIRALARARTPLWGDEAAILLWWLRRQQLIFDGGPAQNRAHGGFTRGFWRTPDLIQVPEVTLTTTRHAVQALDSLGIHGQDPALIAARGFVAGCATPSGPYAEAPGTPPSARATAHTAMILLCGGGSPADVLGLVEALTEQIRLAPFDLELLADQAALLERCGASSGWQDPLIEQVLGAQLDDGSWAGGVADTPVVATAAAITALACALRSWPASGVRRR